VTLGSDGSSGADVAPNNSMGCFPFDIDPLQVDNWVTIAVDADADGLPDMGASPRARVTFHDLALPVRPSSWGALKRRFR